MRGATLAILGLLSACAGADATPLPPQDLGKRAATPSAALDPAIVDQALAGSESAVADLRRLGAPGLAALVAMRGQSDPDRTDARWSALVDGVAQQRDASDGALYWHTDLERASAEAQRTARPILSLRLMGKLTDEYSCANSRFFRTALYSHPELAEWLRESFVLHWSTERPVPQLTIDYGDGRTVRRTLTGNSAHYVLDSEGRPIDALPGLYGPTTFRRELAVSVALHRAIDRDPTQREVLLREHHAARIDEATTALRDDLRHLDLRRPSHRRLRASMLQAQWRQPNRFPTAAEAAPVAMSKAAVELPLVRHATRQRVPASTGGFALTSDGWAELGRANRELGELHPRSLALIERQRPELAILPGELDRLVEAFEESVAADTLFNEYALRVHVHQWFASSAAPQTLDAFNARVYAELFLTPAHDRWLGLVDPGVYTGLVDNGVSQPASGQGLGQASP